MGEAEIDISDLEEDESFQFNVDLQKYLLSFLCLLYVTSVQKWKRTNKIHRHIQVTDVRRTYLCRNHREVRKTRCLCFKILCPST